MKSRTTQALLLGVVLLACGGETSEPLSSTTPPGGQAGGAGGTASTGGSAGQGGGSSSKAGAAGALPQGGNGGQDTGAAGSAGQGSGAGGGGDLCASSETQTAWATFCEGLAAWEKGCNLPPGKMCPTNPAQQAMFQTPLLPALFECLLNRPCSDPKTDKCAQQTGFPPEHEATVGPQIEACFQQREDCAQETHELWDDEYCYLPFALLTTPSLRKTWQDCLLLDCKDIIACQETASASLDLCGKATP